MAKSVPAPKGEPKQGSKTGKPSMPAFEKGGKKKC